MKLKFGSFLSLFFVLAAHPLAFSQIQIQQLTGKVEYRTGKEGAWQTAAKGTEVPPGGAIRTDTDGRATLLFPNRSRLWLRESSGLEVAEENALSHKLSLLWGKIKAKVPHLSRRERFEIRTMTAVCSVRGTEFTLEANEKGEGLAIRTTFGEVKLNLFKPGEEIVAERMEIPQGMGFGGGQVGLLTRTDELEVMSDWSPEVAGEQRFQDLKDKEVARQEVHQFAQRTNEAEEQVRDILVRLKEEDFATGRTLKDVHGNLVRVDQRLLRPTA
ncbi:MAG: FecR domain-containing protein, partial [Elusimicrobia bacterium]|nr:FecR domain-containing protein [Elusimicrobiota bacterium]